MKKKLVLWWTVVSLNVVACAWLGYTAYSGEQGKTWFAPGAATDGHHQTIESCKTCHDPFQGVDNKACLDCHAKDLERGDDKHAESKFLDPRNAALLDKLDATRCITCHGEHDPKRTDRFGVTLPKDFCIECHQDVGETRSSHKGLAFNTCSQAACHNYHDNRALYEDFLIKHLDEPALKSPAVLPVKPAAVNLEKRLSADKHDGKDKADQNILRAWSLSNHAQAGVNCRDCHIEKGKDPEVWDDHPTAQVCKSCHMENYSAFAEGRHGMRQALELEPIIQPRLPMKTGEADLNCHSCHKAHDYSSKFAATESCLSCHNDGHTQAYNGSPHHLAWLNELAGHAAPGTGVSCASCHMPRSDTGDMAVDHNQNRNLRPNEKMVRSVCLSCHGLEFSLKALASPEQIQKNFRSSSSKSLKSMDMARERK